MGSASEGVGILASEPATAVGESVESLPATAIARYEVLNRIAEGSYGTVYRARDRVSGDIVAIKQIKLDAIPKLEGFPASAMREIFALTSLSHPLLLKLRAVASTAAATGAPSQGRVPAEFRGSNQVLMIMDFCDHDIKSFQLALGREFAEAEVKCLALQLLEALDHMHRHHMFHRDLKPANLLCTIDCHLRVADFGLAKRFHTPLVASTSPRFVVTPTYRAIELLLGDHCYGPALDVWSAGCIIAEMLCGSQLFKASSEPELAVKILSVLGLPEDGEHSAAAAAASTSASSESDTAWPGWRRLPYVAALRGVRSLSVVEPSKRPSRLRRHLGLPSRSITGRNCVSDAGIDLLLGMLALNPARRLTAAEAMRHPWFQSMPPQPQRRDLMPRVPSTNENAMRAARDDEAMSGFSTRGSAVEARRMLGLQNG